MALARIRTDLKNLKKHPLSHGCAGPVSETNMYHWEGAIFGADGTPYEGGVFKLDIRFPPEYPMKPPKLAFKTKMYYPHIKDGNISIDILKSNQWSPGFTISMVLQSLAAFLTQANPDEAWNKDIAELYKNDRAFSMMLM